MDLRAIQIRGGPLTDEHITRAECDAWRRTFAAEVLRSDDDLSDETRAAIADLLTEKRGRGRPKAPPWKWHKAGLLYEQGEMTYAEVAAALGLTEKTADRGVKYYRKARRDHDAIE